MGGDVERGNLGRGIVKMGHLRCSQFYNIINRRLALLDKDMFSVWKILPGGKNEI